MDFIISLFFRQQLNSGVSILKVVKCITIDIGLLLMVTSYLIMELLICKLLLKEGYDNTFLKESILERIKDDSPEVVLAALQALKVS